jgi:hypothetical protein
LANEGALGITSFYAQRGAATMRPPAPAGKHTPTAAFSRALEVSFKIEGCCRQGNPMAVRIRSLSLSGAALLAASLAVSAAHAQGHGKFNAAVERMLMNMKTGAVSQMSQAEKKELVACVQKVFSGISNEKKRYIAEAKDQAELEARFDKVGLENQAALKQQVRDECS